MFDENPAMQERFSKLTQKEQKWLLAYHRGLNLTDAAKEAGYKNPDKNGSRNKLKLQEFVMEINREKRDKNEVLREELLMFWDKCRKDESLPIKERRLFSDMEAKSLGMYETNLNIKGDEDNPMQIVSNISLQDKLKFIKELKGNN